MTWLWIWLLVVLKIPVAIGAYVVWWAIQDPPDQVIGDDPDDGINYTPGPRTRGPHDGARAKRRRRKRRREADHPDTEPAKIHQPPQLL